MNYLLKIEKDVRQWLYKNRWLLAVSFLLAAAVHYQIWSNGLQNPDSYWIGQVYQADHWGWLPNWETMQGRWGLWAVDAARGSLNNATLTALPMLACYTLAGVLIADLFNIGKLRLLAVLLIDCAPATAAVESYRYCCASYGLSFLLAVLAVWCVVYGKEKVIPSTAAGALCLMLSLSLYQTGLAVAAALSLLVLAQRALESQREKLLSRLLGMGLCGTAFYYAVYQLLLRVNGLQAAGYGGADTFGLSNILRNLGTAIGQTYLDFVRYYFGHTIAANGYGVRGVMLLFFLMGSVALTWRLWRLHSIKKAVQIAVCIALLPVAVNLMGVLLPGNTLLLRTAGGLLPILPFLLAQAEAAWADGPQQIACGGAALLALLIVRGYLLQVNTDAMTMLAYKQQYVTVMRQVEADVTARPEYKTAEGLAVVGKLPSDNFPLEPTLRDSADPFAKDTAFWGMGFSDRVVWINGFYEKLGWQPTFCDEAHYTDITNTPAFWQMPCYPEEGSVQMMDGILVVKIS